MTSYEDEKRKRMAENQKRLEALNIPTISQELAKSYSATSKHSKFGKGKSKFVQPGALEVANKKRLRSQGLPHASSSPTHLTASSPTHVTPSPHNHVTPPSPTHVTPPSPTHVTPSLPSSEATSPHHDIPSLDSGDDDVDNDVDEELTITQKKKSKYWDVEVINEAGHVSRRHLTVADVLEESPNGTRIMTRWNDVPQVVGQAAGLLANYLGSLARQYRDFPIMFESWDAISDDKKTEFYNVKIKTKFVVDDGDQKKYIISSIGKKWKDGRSRLFTKHYKWELTLEENLKNRPSSVDPDSWAVFVNYRRKPKNVEIAQRNARNRKKLTIPHTLGAKTLARTRDELELRDGRKYSRGDMYSVSHKYANGSFVNEGAKEKFEQLQAEMQNTQCENEAFVKVFGKDHPGYVRSMGLGITPSQISSQTTRSASSSIEANEKMLKMQAEIDSLKDKASQVDILKAQVAFLMQMQMQNSHIENEPTNVGSAKDGRHSSDSSHRLEDH